MFIGNTGAGKSALLNQLGGNFPSDISCRHGVTTDISEALVDLDGEKVVLMDVPGLNEPSKEVNDRNARILIEALARGYDYKLMFVFRHSERTVEAPDLGLLQQVNLCLRKANIFRDGGADGIDGAESSRISFGIIVNGIPGKKAYKHYERFRDEKFRSVFQGLHTPDVPFDIQVDEVLLLKYDDEVEERVFREILTEFVKARQAVPISVEGDINVSDSLLARIRLGLEKMKGLAIGVVSLIAVVAVAVIDAKMQGII
ncbi:hypothetical protein BGZ52_008272 [Haplosporangium bisporale]|nr:hypothetical protein BGZ52_008272 [Haplosporangium bisporale]